MSDQPDLKFLGERIERIQQDLGTMRLRDEQREMAYQAMFQTLTRQIVEMADHVGHQIDRTSVDLSQSLRETLAHMIAAFETRLMERLAEIEKRLP